MRVVSLLAGGTEILCALGAGDTLVGRSHECDNPPWVRQLPSCTRPAFEVNQPSGKIDAEVRRRLKNREPLYHVDTELIRELRPDLIIAQAHCEVCAVTPGDLDRADPGRLCSQILPLSAGSLQGIYDDISQIARAIHRPAEGDHLISQMRGRIAEVSESVHHRPSPSVVTLEWMDPIFLSGNWAPELVEAARGRPLLSDARRHSQTILWERIRESDPDYLIVAPCGFDIARTLQEVPELQSLPGWSDLKAVRSGRVALADGNLYFNRSGTTVVGTVEILADILHGLTTPSSPHDGCWRWLT